MNDNKKIAYNTVTLYIKLILSTIISFVTARIVLDTLGASDYGLYNVVGGFVAILNIIATSMIATSYRYIAIEIGKGIEGNVNKTYNTIFVIHIILAIILLIIGETLGIYYIENFLNIDVGKLSDAKYVFRLSLLTTSIYVTAIPLNGILIAHEKFIFTSLIEIFSSIFKLLLIISLSFIDVNKLRLYAVFIALIHLITPICFFVYCYIKYKIITKWKLNVQIRDYKEIIIFTSWMLLGSVAVVGNTHGSAIIINFFFGTIVNASFGLATQVSNASIMFTSTLRQAAVPQIMKNYSSGNNDRSISLVYSISRISYFLMLIIAFPVLFRLTDLLKIWLNSAPKFTEIFITFMIINGLITSLGSGFDASIQSTGKVKKNQIGYSIINLSLLPLIFILYRLEFPPYINVITMVFLSIISLIFQTYIMTELTSFNLIIYFRTTIIPCLKTTIISFIPLYTLNKIIGDSLIETLSFILISIIWTTFSIYLGGTKEFEKNFIKNIIFSKKRYYRN